MSATALAVSLVGSYYDQRVPPDSILLWSAVGWVVVMASIMACSVHWLSDVLAGFFYGATVGIAALRAPTPGDMQRLPHENASKRLIDNPSEI